MGVIKVKTYKNIENLVASFEGCYLKAYKCPAGVWTIGYGHTQGVKQGQKITQAQATKYLKEDLNKVKKNLYKREYCINCGNPNFRNAMISFAFNCGEGCFDQLRQFGDWYLMLKNLHQFCHAKVNGKMTTLNGLVRRRREELAFALKYHSNNTTFDYFRSTTLVAQGMLNHWADKHTSKKYTPLKRDGIFKEETKKRIIEFQKAYRLTANGVLNKATWDKLVELDFELKVQS